MKIFADLFLLGGGGGGGGSCESPEPPGYGLDLQTFCVVCISTIYDFVRYLQPINLAIGKVYL